MTVDPDARGSRPAHRRGGLLALVLLGGAVGAPLRYLLSRALPTATDHFPWATFVTNVGGAFALGLLLELLIRRGSDTGVRRGIRLLLGTGVLGAFTTYSTLVTETDLLVRDGHTALAAGYCTSSVAAGLVAVVLGLTLARLTPVHA